MSLKLTDTRHLLVGENLQSPLNAMFTFWINCSRSLI